MMWLNVNFVMPPNLFIHWECWSGGNMNKKVQKGLCMIWEAGIWVLSKARNDRIFINVIVTWEEIVEEVKVMTWRWMLSRTTTPTCMFYEWSWSPRDCLAR